MGNRILLFFCICFAVLATIFAQRDVIGRIQSINLEQVIDNDRLFNNFYKCLADEGRCSKDANSIKGLITEVVKTKCSQCTDVERTQIKKSLDLVRKKKPEQFNSLAAKYDPQGVWKDLVK
ncbi:ejaculatory bulb-specific protein 3-like [Agrilus planipennis]|uniref:Ejaculatory bulb-specific protein 3-like n=1 Tax=Agrilus planipennis TaxID=224129 RepID=A0A7F5R5S2_AGRPL|nr:ejaculatory bulb-specific protein 3-like [Agrilus planipennis]